MLCFGLRDAESLLDLIDAESIEAYLGDLRMPRILLLPRRALHS